MALNAGDMLYYDGTKWVNSSTLVSSLTLQGTTTLQIADTGTGALVRPILCSHSLTGGPAAAGCGAGIQFLGTSEIGDIDCTVGAASPLSSYFSLWSRNNSGNLAEMLRLGSTGGAPAAFFGAPLVGLGVPLQFAFEIFTMADGDFTMLSGDYQNPFLEMQGTISANRNITMPSYKGSVWFVHNNTTSPFSLTFKTAATAGIAIAYGKRAIIYADGASIVRLTPDT
jgi:hypothetical protein